jgi:hypothetical protein
MSTAGCTCGWVRCGGIHPYAPPAPPAHKIGFLDPPTKHHHVLSSLLPCRKSHVHVHMRACMPSCRHAMRMPCRWPDACRMLSHRAVRLLTPLNCWAAAPPAALPNEWGVIIPSVPRREGWLGIIKEFLHSLSPKHQSF